MQCRTFTFVFCVSLFLGSLSAQITISASILPTIGDTDQRIIVSSLSSVDASIGVGADSEIYEFSGLTGPEVTQKEFYDPAEIGLDSLYPDADLAASTRNKLYDELISKNETGLKLIGGVSMNPIVAGDILTWKVDGDYYLFKTPLNYKDTDSQEVNLYSALSSEFLPDSILQSFPLSVDSFKFKYKITTETTVDGYGRIYINDFNSVEVLRQDYYQHIDPRVEAYNAITKWMDITDLVKGNFPELNEFLEKETIKAYRYYSEESSFALLEAQTDDRENIEMINYRNEDLSTFTIDIEKSEQHGYDISVNPNPSDGKVSLQAKVNRPGDYTIRVLNIIGYQLWSKDFYIYDEITEELDFSDLRRGTYFYSLVSPDGKILATKRMLIVGA